MSNQPKPLYKNRARLGNWTYEGDFPVAGDLTRVMEPWLTALFQSEHLSLLLGSGFTISVANRANTSAAGMSTIEFEDFGIEKVLAENLSEWSNNSSRSAGRGSANIEDQIRAALHLQVGLEILKDPRNHVVRKALNKILSDFLLSILDTESNILKAFGTPSGREAQHLLVSFLMSFANRTATRERLNLFTTNYDRLIEYGCDLAGLRIVDRFVGSLTPIFRSSRADIDMHYNPPGIRGEPRFLEGVVKFTKLHGSLDWRMEHSTLKRYGIAFGASKDHPALPKEPLDSVMIYPNPAKDIETGEYPYADLFRDFSSALCRPNSVLVTFGYGFGDDHINRVIGDMLTIPSTHLVVLAYSDSTNRVKNFIERCGRESQVSFLIGPDFGSVEALAKHYLPKQSIDLLTMKRASILQMRGDDGSAQKTEGTGVTKRQKRVTSEDR